MRIFSPEEIRSIRKNIGLTQSELADKAGVTQAYIAKIESGNADPRTSTLKRISKALNQESESNTTTAEQIMAKPIVSVSPSDSIKVAIKHMENFDISQLPVIDENKQVGSLADEDIIHEISNDRNMIDLEEKKVERIMQEPFPTVGVDAGLNTIFPLLEHNPAVLVLNKSDPVGIITKADILRLSEEKNITQIQES